LGKEVFLVAGTNKGLGAGTLASIIGLTVSTVLVTTFMDSLGVNTVAGISNVGVGYFGLGMVITGFEPFARKWSVELE
jgi:xanthine/uracil permease